MGNGEMARSDLESIVGQSPTVISEAYARSGLGRACALLGDFDRAFEEFESSEAITPENAWLQMNIAMSLESMGEKRRALNAYRAALRLDAPALPRWEAEYARIRIEELT